PAAPRSPPRAVCGGGDEQGAAVGIQQHGVFVGEVEGQGIHCGEATRVEDLPGPAAGDGARLRQMCCENMTDPRGPACPGAVAGVRLIYPWAVELCGYFRRMPLRSSALHLVP